MVTDAGPLNFVVVGDVRAGTSIVQDAVGQRPGCYCHADPFHCNRESRQASHEAYYGPCPDPENSPEWWVEGGVLSPLHYANILLTRSLHGEQAVGFRAHYPAICALELFEIFDKRCLEGDFCLVHVVRNPIACFVSLKQSERSGVWSRRRGEPAKARPLPVSIDVHELMTFIQRHISTQKRIAEHCDDALVVPYTDLCFDFDAAMRRVFDFIELPDDDTPPKTNCARLNNRDMPARIVGLDALRKTAPREIRELLDAEDFV